uniref:Uncharacterized protein n=1 Tax=Chromera velia CCMP2878 TaxID=1169474 RepID=A0A0G4HFV9_9ALVE|eukprot:Cvel_6698.t1-p1 / transcript=Cvel_6698.t1 / gene=Cvel_6698 / organism=Chromera_velia_CCMP2878 / gene_product=hypothetical protein / transcript_product=hypothetical protein / location=Cvel_scaffold334:7587-12024(+) / protein_length=370 / sequence_SO=supercontig / SO=protein_coding / is_pseudo=false
MRGKCLPLGLIDFQKAEIREDTVAPTKEGSTKGALSLEMPKQQLTGKPLSPHSPNMPQLLESGKSDSALNRAQFKRTTEGGVWSMLLTRLDHHRDALEELQYSKAQGMESFRDAFLDLAEEIKDTSTPADLIHIFKKAIPDAICLEVNKKAPFTLEEAVEAVCIAAETLEERGGNRKRHAQTGGSRPNGKHQGVPPEKFTLADLDDNYDVYLGMKWLIEHEPHMHWGKGEVEVPIPGAHGRLVTIKSQTQTSVRTLSSKELKREVRKGRVREVYLCRLEMVEPVLAPPPMTLEVEPPGEAKMTAAIREETEKEVPEGETAEEKAEREKDETLHRGWSKVMSDPSLHPAARRVVGEYRNIFCDEIPKLPPR